MPTERVVIVGAGGHGRVVMDALLTSRADAAGIVFAADDESVRGSTILGRPVEGTISACVGVGTRFHVAIGDNEVREQVTIRLLAAGAEPVAVVHPQARVSPFADLGSGLFVAAGAVVGPLARIGAGTIVNHGAVVDHDCVVGEFSHVGPNATLAGAVRVGRGVLIGAGANLLPGVSIGDAAIVGAGAVVIDDVPAGATVAGIPARLLKETVS